MFLGFFYISHHGVKDITELQTSSSDVGDCRWHEPFTDSWRLHQRREYSRSCPHDSIPSLGKSTCIRQWHGGDWLFTSRQITTDEAKKQFDFLKRDWTSIEEHMTVLFNDNIMLGGDSSTSTEMLWTQFRTRLMSSVDKHIPSKMLRH